MQANDMRAKLVEQQTNQSDAPLATVGIVSQALVAGFWTGSWIVAIFMLIVPPMLLVAPAFRKPVIAAFMVLWAYLGYGFGRWIGGGEAGLVCAAMAAGLSFAAHSAFAQTMDDQGRLQAGAQAMRPIKVSASRYPEVATAEQALIARIRSYQANQLKSKALRIVVVGVLALVPAVWIFGNVMEHYARDVAAQTLADFEETQTGPALPAPYLALSETSEEQTRRRSKEYESMLRHSGSELGSRKADTEAIARYAYPDAW